MNCIVILSSITYALKGKKILESEGINAKLVKTGNVIKHNGCGYGIEIRLKNKDKTMGLLNSENIRIIDIVGDAE